VRDAVGIAVGMGILVMIDEGMGARVRFRHEL